jgi:hypothetical protein
VVNAVVVSLASNGAYTAMTNVITNQEARIAKETAEASEPADPEQGDPVPPVI